MTLTFLLDKIHVKSSSKLHELIYLFVSITFILFHNIQVHCFIYRVSDGWMFCDFTFFSKVFQSYQDDVKLIMKGCVRWDPVYTVKMSVDFTVK